MARYKNREVTVIEELPHPNGDQVRIQHKEPGVSGYEIVPRGQVWVSEEELKVIKEARDKSFEANEFKIQGKDPYVKETLPSTSEVEVQKMAERNLERIEEDKKERDEFYKRYPNAPADAFAQWQTSKVVPAEWETKEVKKTDKGLWEKK